MKNTPNSININISNKGRKDEALANLNKAMDMHQEMGIEYWPDKIQEVLDRF